MKLEAQEALEKEREIGPAIYSGILSQPDLFSAVVEHVTNVLAGPSTNFRTVLEPPAVMRLFQEQLTQEDKETIVLDIMASAIRKPCNQGSAMKVIMFNAGFHALVCYRVAHRLWLAGRKGLAYLIQSSVSSTFSCDIHPGAKIGAGIYLAAGAGVVIGETAVVKDDVSIFQGVTLGGTGKDRGDRHPKIGQGVILQDSAVVLGNIVVGEWAVITAKSIVLKDVPPMARVSGIPAKVKSYRNSGNYLKHLSGKQDSGFDDWEADWMTIETRQIFLKAFLKKNGK